VDAARAIKSHVVIICRAHDGDYDVSFSTGGCLGSCELPRTATIDNGLITLNAAVAEYVPNTYRSLYVIRVRGSDYLLPTTSVADFEREIAAGTDHWQRYVLRRLDSSAPTGGK
jgi:hypothetical protein